MDILKYILSITHEEWERNENIIKNLTLTEEQKQ